MAGETTDARFVAIDWGTTSFRLWLVGRDGAVLGESRSREGMTTARETGFRTVLDTHLSIVGAPENAPILMCGMVGAKQGWIEAGYIDTPAALSAIPGGAVRVPDTRDIRILPGLAQRDMHAADVMRGEETQLLGSTTSLDGADCLVVMPGTHSKWVGVEAGAVTSFATFMTGELFDVIGKQSILQHAVQGSSGFDGSDAAFVAAVETAFAAPQRATNMLFSIRAGGLLFGRSATESEATLSGILIGLELAGGLAMADRSRPVVLVASGKLGSLYEAAFARLGRTITTVDADVAVLNGLSQAADSIWPIQG
jgi:2-dehydro-3-deoxygalactonokinase